MEHCRSIVVIAVLVAMSGASARLAAQAGSSPAAPPAGAAEPPATLPVAPAGATSPVVPPTSLPTDYVIGVDDILSITFWRDADMTVDSVVVRPDGRISLPILNEVQAAGLTPEQLRTNVTAVAAKFKADPIVHVVVKQVNSRRVFLMGEVAKPGPYPLSARLTVMQLLALAGGLNEYAKTDDIAVIRTENGQERRYRVNYKDIRRGRNLRQNIELKVGDVIVVP
jgi:polysaccharide export outer membrane protein